MRSILLLLVTVSFQASILQAACNAQISALNSQDISSRPQLGREDTANDNQKQQQQQHGGCNSHQLMMSSATHDDDGRNQTNSTSTTTTTTTATSGKIPHISRMGASAFDRHLHDMGGFRLEYNKFKILSHLGISENLDELNPTIDEDVRQNLSSSAAAAAAAISDNTNRSSGSRRKRSLSCEQVKSDKDACCLQNFYVNFTHIGWDKWILYPAGYNANYCKGQCDLSHTRYYHSTLLSKYSNMISLCCSPKQMAPLRLLYIDEENKVHQKSIPDMIVESCDCA